MFWWFKLYYDGIIIEWITISEQHTINYCRPTIYMKSLKGINFHTL